ncbi:MAG: Asp-tRNA(Asn)/Glu-tRNA(Gln) amidotransferase subunit GatA [Candidatus Micrarchaeia archaeon]
MGVFETAKAVRDGRLSAEERTAGFLEAIRKRDGRIHAFVEVFEKDALAKAREIDARARRGERLGRLAGVVFSIKSNLCLKGKRATCSSKMLENYVAPYTATAVQRLLAEDAIIIGSTNMDEFACGSDTTHSAFFPTRNPLDEERVPGGSSGGAAASVAAGFCDAALGTDTGGSIRCPAAFCGVVGFKPSYGLVSRYGLIDMGMSLDQIGPLAADSASAAQVLSVIAGEDKLDPVTAGVKPREFNLAAQERLRVGVPKQFFEGVNAEVGKAVREAAGKLEKTGASLIEVSIPSIEYAIPIYYLLNFAEFSSAMQRYDGLRYGAAADLTKPLIAAVSEVRDRALGKEVKRRILLGTFITMKEFHEAWLGKTLRARAALKKEFEAALAKCDVLFGPAMPVLPWKIGEKLNPLEMYLSDVLTVSANLCGIPAGVIPCGKIGGLSVGAQFHAKAFEDEKALAAMKLLEERHA